ncbi:MAG: response regulator [Planctomycetes bacterium]|nr:response regulator [Planctomycetota bacterium]
MRVLLVDDSKVMRNVEKGILAKLGLTDVEEAGNGAEALTKVESYQPELILLDWNMPVMDGLTFLTTIRGQGNKTPVIMVTTEAEKTRVLDAIKAGVNNYCIKPFTPETLSKCIEKTVGLVKAA